ncbi:hypothetical protein COS79_01095 [Candidatus Woesearchaeota archaeon CG06_land_8_20_14_3_00_33_13]|nr:MAG: hypothetical protein COS79_01095 [Candidatus Woesearchaeota archaeon CG06_land_8_20_14_3_00_33_13]
MTKRIIKKLKEHFKEVLGIKTSPHSIALGFAIGTFIAIIPTFGFTYLIATIVMLVYAKESKLALFGALLLWNPFVLFPLYTLSYRFGDFILSGFPEVYPLQAIGQFRYTTLRFLVGNFIIAVFFSVTSYFILRKLVSYSKKQTFKSSS